METNSFDNQIKNNLEQRTIEPSEKSWEQLRSKLDKKDKKTISLYWWMGVTASFVGGILVVNLIFNNSPANPQIQVTENDIEIIFDTEEQFLVRESSKILESITNQEIIAEEKENPKKDTQPVMDIKPKLIVESSERREVLEEKHLQFVVEEALVETVEIIKNSSVTETEVDALLEQAFAEIRAKQTQNNKSISANYLLEEVEEEVERSFRDRVFELLKDGFNLSKDALANRNQ